MWDQKGCLSRNQMKIATGQLKTLDFQNLSKFTEKIILYIATLLLFIKKKILKMF